MMGFKCVIFKPIPVIDILYIPHETALKWMPQDNIDDKSKLIQVMHWCHHDQATSHT